VMAAAPEEQLERAFQEQWFVFSAGKKLSKRHSNREGRPRYYKNVGLGFATPKLAIDGTYVDKKCPWTSNTSIRGRIVRGIVAGNKMRRTISVRRNYLKYEAKYARYEKRHKNFLVHCSPALEPEQGDEVICGQCRPLSKTVRFNVLQVNPKSRGSQNKGTGKVSSGAGAGKKFTKE